MAALADRHQEFLDAGGRLFGISSDSPAQNSAVIEEFALPFPILSDDSRQEAIEPLGFADEEDPRQIAKTGVVVLSPEGTEVFRYVGREYADRPHEDRLLEAVEKLGLPPTRQPSPTIGPGEPGERAMIMDALPHYLRGAKFGVLAIRSRHRDISEEFREDSRAYVQMVDRFLDALSKVEERKA